MAGSSERAERQAHKINPVWYRVGPALCLVLRALLVGGGAGPEAGASANTAAVAPATPQAKQPAQPQTDVIQYGFVMALLGNNPTVRSMGFGWVQYGVYWKEAEPSPGSYNWGNVDNIVNAARNSGLNVLIRVSRPPGWARDPACSSVDTCPPRNAADFGRFSYQLAAHVRSLTPYGVAYEIWNEPNTSQEWGNLCPDPARYTELLRAVYPQIKAADPSAQVVGGAITTVGELALPAECHLDDIAFLQQMYSAGARPYFDILSDHPYGFISPPEAAVGVGGSNRLIFRRAERHRDIMVQYGDAAKKIWATEMGWAIDPRTEGSNCPPPDWYFVFTPQQQADYMVRAYNYARSYWPWMGAMFVFNFDFNEAPWYENCFAFRFWSVKNRPAQNALAQQALYPPPTYTPVPATPTSTPVPPTPTSLPDGPPVISAIRYSSLQFTRLGGTLTIEVDANDADGTPIDTVQANVNFPDNTYQVINFDLVAGTTSNGTWRAGLAIAPNDTNGNQTYSVTPYVIETFPPRRTTVAPQQQIVAVNTRFIDVPADFWAYQYIEALANMGVIGGYPDGTFRPANSTTRGQLTKITMLAFGYPLVNGEQRFSDVLPGSPFYTYIQTAANYSIVGGYPCGGPGEPCDPQGRPYFRPGNSITRGQITKIVVLSAQWDVPNPANPTFADVSPGSPFYAFVEAAAAHTIIGGYPCGGPGEPCDPLGRPYFRPANNTSRAQITKMVYLAINQPTPTPTATNTPVPPTSTPTATPTSTYTPTPTATASATATSTPSATTTSTAMPTFTPTATTTATPPGIKTK